MESAVADSGFVKSGGEVAGGLGSTISPPLVGQVQSPGGQCLKRSQVLGVLRHFFELFLLYLTYYIIMNDK